MRHICLATLLVWLSFPVWAQKERLEDPDPTVTTASHPSEKHQKADWEQAKWTTVPEEQAYGFAEGRAHNKLRALCKSKGRLYEESRTEFVYNECETRNGGKERRCSIKATTFCYTLFDPNAGLDGTHDSGSSANTASSGGSSEGNTASSGGANGSGSNTAGSGSSSSGSSDTGGTASAASSGSSASGGHSGEAERIAAESARRQQMSQEQLRVINESLARSEQITQENIAAVQESAESIASACGDMSWYACLGGLAGVAFFTTLAFTIDPNEEDTSDYTPSAKDDPLGPNFATVTVFTVQSLFVVGGSAAMLLANYMNDLSQVRRRLHEKADVVYSQLKANCEFGLVNECEE